MHLRFGMIWAAVAAILVDLGTSAEQSRWIDNVDQYNKKNPLHPINLLDVLEKEGYDEETLIKSVFLPNMDKEVIAQTSGIRNLFEDKEKFEEALIDVQQYAKTRLTNELIKSWLDKELGVDAVIDRLGLSPKASQTASSGQSSKASETAYDFSRYNTLVMYEHAWYLRYRPNSLNVQANNVMEQKGEMDSDAKIWKRKRKWKKRKEREF
ncbi:unnamed protein product [Peronospora effusa]|nr:unnamed protein product [Peronospora effusa]